VLNVRFKIGDAVFVDKITGHHIIDDRPIGSAGRHFQQNRQVVVTFNDFGPGVFRSYKI